MYNSHIATKVNKKRQHTIDIQQHEKRWRKKYKTKDQPKLLSNYYKRIDSFIVDLEDGSIQP